MQHSNLGPICSTPSSSSAISSSAGPQEAEQTNAPISQQQQQQQQQQMPRPSTQPPSTASGLGGTAVHQQSRDYAVLHLEVFELLCTFHRVKRIQSKDTTQCGQLVQDIGQTNEQRAEQINRSLYKIINEVETKVIILPSTNDQVTSEYFDEWSFLTWALLMIINRLEAMDAQEIGLLDYGGKHFQEKIHAALVDLVNKAHRMQPPPTVQQNDTQFDRFYQAYVTALISLHELYTRTQQNGGVYPEFEAHIGHFKKQLVACFVLQRDFANCHGFMLWRQLREHQIRKMTHFGYENKNFLDSAVSFYAHMLYNLGVLAARIQGFFYELGNNKAFAGAAGCRRDSVSSLLAMVYQMADVLLSDSIICMEPSQNPILVTNNLFPMKIISLCRFSFFRDFSLQIVSEEVAQQIQQEMRHRKTFDPPSPIRKTQTAALLAMKPATGVKRNNAKASEEGGNTAHKKSDVNSKEWISIPPLFDTEHGGWCATYPHLLCTTRQKDTLLETRSAMQTGKRPLFYFHVRAEMFSFSGNFSTAHTLSLPFTIATRRNQDCQVQRMMSSYTATCFWLYGTNVLDGLLIQWFDGEIDWKHFKILYSLYFAMNAEVMRTFTDEDFNILQQKMHCPECTENQSGSSSQGGGHHQQQLSLLNRVSFKNVLCPHLHFSAAKCDLRFSVWRGMLELLHLFNDQKTETRNLWETGLLLGFLELKKVHSMLRTLPGSGLVMRLSLVAGACVCITVKCINGEILDLEPLDVKRIQAKNLHDYLRDIILAEKVDFVLDSNKEWLHVAEVMKRCQKCSASSEQTPTPPKTREVLSNALHPGPVDKEHKIAFTTMRVAVVTCKPNTADNNNEPDDEFAGEHTKTDGDQFEENLEQLLRTHGKTPEQAMEILSRLANRRNQPSAAAAAVIGQVQVQQQQGQPPPPLILQMHHPQFYEQQLPSSSSIAIDHAKQHPMPCSSSSLGTPPQAQSIYLTAFPLMSSGHPQNPTAQSSASTALGSNLEDPPYPHIHNHHNNSTSQQQQEQQQQQSSPVIMSQAQQSFYFGNVPFASGANPSMPTMNMPIVVMPAGNGQQFQGNSSNSSSFMLFPATAGHLKFASSSPTSSSSLSGAAISFSEASSIHSHQPHMLLSTPSPIAILHQQQAAHTLSASLPTSAAQEQQSSHQHQQQPQSTEQQQFQAQM